MADYAKKYRLSVSTLRRRIKADQLEYKLSGGKYFLVDTPPVVEEAGEESEQTHSSYSERAEVSSAPSENLEFQRQDLELLDAQILGELKRAYMSILHEKEDQITLLKEEVSDLKTLVRVLEQENERMKKFLHPEE